jgi:hypothetical protein
MRWADEDWIKLYTRDTPDFLSLSFEAQALFVLLLRKVDRAGLLPLGKRGRASIFLALGQAHRAADLGPALDELVADGCVIVDEERRVMVVRNFAEAQTTRASDASRKRSERARDSAEASKSAMFGENCHAPSHDVTRGHEERRGEEKRREKRDEREEKIPHSPPPEPNTAGADAPAPPAAGTKGKRPKVKRERVLSATSVAVGEFIDATAQVEYPPASFDVLERVLRDDGLTHDDALLVVQQAARDPWCLGTIRLDPTVLFRRERWPGLLAHAKAGAPPKVPAKHRAEALDLYVPPPTPERSQGDVESEMLRAAKAQTQAPEVQALERWPSTGDVTEAECTSCHKRSRAVWVVTHCDDVIAVLPASDACATHATRSAWDAISHACEGGLIANLRGALDALQPNGATMQLVREIVDSTGWRAEMLRPVLVRPAPLRAVGGAT